MSVTLQQHGDDESATVVEAVLVGLHPTAAAPAVLVATRGHPLHAALVALDPSYAVALTTLSKNDSHLLHSLQLGERRAPAVVCVGATPRATLYAVYALAEHLGARFTLNADILPEPDPALSLPPAGFSQTFTPRFSVRGLQPFHDFPMGLDFWRALATNMAKMKLCATLSLCFPPSVTF